MRSKVKILIGDEKPSIYFLNQEKRRAEKKILHRLETGKGELIENKAGILKYVREFYAQLFSREEIDQSLVDYFFLNFEVFK